MRRKKHKASRRIVRFYKLHFGFREPFKVLLDGNFICAMSQLKYHNIEDLVESLLGSKVKLFVPSCVMRELRELSKQDKSFQAAVSLAKKFVRHKDGCPPSETASEILLKQVANENQQHWWLATQDKALWTTFQQDKSSVVPVIYVSASGLHLLPPGEVLQKSVSEKTMANMHVGSAEESKLQEGLAQLAPQPRGKRRRASAPNPLSVKKKKDNGMKSAQHDTKHKRRKRKTNPADDT